MNATQVDKQPEPLIALEQAMQRLSDAARHRFSAPEMRTHIERALADLQIVRMGLSAGGCKLCGSSRGHDYGCPNDPLGPASHTHQATESRVALQQAREVLTAVRAAHPNAESESVGAQAAEAIAAIDRVAHPGAGMGA